LSSVITPTTINLNADVD